MAYRPIPVTFVSQTAALPAGSEAPRPYEIVGALPAGALDVPVATLTTAGVVKKAAAPADATVLADIYASLQAAGIIA